MTAEQWIHATIKGMLQAFMNSPEHYSTPLATVIYWMPRIAPVDAGVHRVCGDPLNHWTIPLKQVGQPWETAATITRLRTDQVAHWLHISMQDMVGFLALCNAEEAEALNHYLHFRMEYMRLIQTMPMCFQWIQSSVLPQPGDQVYELLLKLRSIDDEHQRLLAWTIHASVQGRRNEYDIASFPRCPPYQYSSRGHRAMFEYMQKTWSLYRARTSPLIEWQARDPLLPGFIDMRSFSRWFVVEDPPLDSLTIEQVQHTIDADMMFRTTVERDRNAYLQGDVMKDEIWFALNDTRPFFPHQPRPLQPQYDEQGLPKPISQLIGLNMHDDDWWRRELNEVVDWYHGRCTFNESYAAIQSIVELSLQGI
ncbi:hypothetical protein BGZ54_007773 [Gamsiella multidivaricata]|nr:hypothetical protein BGZ54_007773 [Gamsiella multidivaricata]